MVKWSPRLTFLGTVITLDKAIRARMTSAVRAFQFGSPMLTNKALTVAARVSAFHHLPRSNTALSAGNGHSSSCAESASLVEGITGHTEMVLKVLVDALFRPSLCWQLESAAFLFLLVVCVKVCLWCFHFLKFYFANYCNAEVDSFFQAQTTRPERARWHLDQPRFLNP